jgi:CO/xanthine dehydrogenase FAD-binding subunit
MGTVAGGLSQRPRKYHAILGNRGPAYFVSASSLGPALGAKIKVTSAFGGREIDAEKFFVTPENEAAREIALRLNELVATASVALKMAGGKVASARVVLGHVAPTPWPATAADRLLAGKPITPAVYSCRAGEICGHRYRSNGGRKLGSRSSRTRCGIARLQLFEMRAGWTADSRRPHTGQRPSPPSCRH